MVGSPAAAEPRSPSLIVDGAMAGRARLGRIQQRLDAFEARLPAVGTARGLVVRDRHHAGSVLAAGLAFRIFLMLLPLYLLAASALGFLAGGSGGTVPAVESTLRLGGAVAKAINSSAAEAHDGQWVLLLTGMVLLVYTLNSALRALRLVHVVAWQDRPGRSGPVATALASLLLIAMLLWGALASVLIALVPYLGPLIGVLLVAALGGTWLLLSTLLPHGAAPWRALVPGAALVAVGLGAMYLVSSYYLPHKLSSTSQLYGALGIAATVMTWLFLGCRLIVAATVLNAMRWERGRDLEGEPGQHASAALDAGAGGDGV
jgi:uncharacterized BrkB/YihY/UPF0761 family membrane protein